MNRNRRNFLAWLSLVVLWLTGCRRRFPLRRRRERPSSSTKPREISLASVSAPAGSNQWRGFRRLRITDRSSGRIIFDGDADLAPVVEPGRVVDILGTT